MNNDLEQFSEERLMELIHESSKPEIEALARIALSVKQAKPVGYVLCNHGNPDIDFVFADEDSAIGTSEHLNDDADGRDEWTVMPFYTTPQPAHAEQDGWIKCSDDLPLIGVEVQVYIPGNAPTGRPTVTAMARFINRQGAPDYFWDKSTGKGGMTLDTSVTHWRPLAAAPKPESE